MANDEKQNKEPTEPSSSAENKSTVDSKPNQTDNGLLNELMNKVNSLKQEVIDYIDLKFQNAPIAKVEKVETEKPKELPKW